MTHSIVGRDQPEQPLWCPGVRPVGPRPVMLPGLLTAPRIPVAARRLGKAGLMPADVEGLEPEHL